MAGGPALRGQGKAKMCVTVESIDSQPVSHYHLPSPPDPRRYFLLTIPTLRNYLMPNIMSIDAEIYGSVFVPFTLKE